MTRAIRMGEAAEARREKASKIAGECKVKLADPSVTTYVSMPPGHNKMANLVEPEGYRRHILDSDEEELNNLPTRGRRRAWER